MKKTKAQRRQNRKNRKNRVKRVEILKQLPNDKNEISFFNNRILEEYVPPKSLFKFRDIFSNIPSNNPIDLNVALYAEFLTSGSPVKDDKSTTALLAAGDFGSWQQLKHGNHVLYPQCKELVGTLLNAKFNYTDAYSIPYRNHYSVALPKGIVYDGIELTGYNVHFVGISKEEDSLDLKKYISLCRSRSTIDEDLLRAYIGVICFSLPSAILLESDHCKGRYMILPVADFHVLNDLRRFRKYILEICDDASNETHDLNKMEEEIQDLPDEVKRTDLYRSVQNKITDAKKNHLLLDEFKEMVGCKSDYRVDEEKIKLMFYSFRLTLALNIYVLTFPDKLETGYTLPVSKIIQAKISRINALDEKEANKNSRDDVDVVVSSKRPHYRTWCIRILKSDRYKRDEYGNPKTVFVKGCWVGISSESRTVTHQDE